VKDAALPSLYMPALQPPEFNSVFVLVLVHEVYLLCRS
jgi:hypothetical protein